MKASTIVEIPSRKDLSVLVQFGNNAATRTYPTADDLDGIFRFQPHHGHGASNAVYVRDEHTELCDLVIQQALDRLLASHVSCHVEPTRSRRNFGLILILQRFAQYWLAPVGFVRPQDDCIHPRQRRELDG